MKRIILWLSGFLVGAGLALVIVEPEDDAVNVSRVCRQEGQYAWYMADVQINEGDTIVFSPVQCRREGI